MSGDREEVGPQWTIVCECFIVIKMDDAALWEERMRENSPFVVKIVAAWIMSSFDKPAAYDKLGSIYRAN